MATSLYEQAEQKIRDLWPRALAEKDMRIKTNSFEPLAEMLAQLATAADPTAPVDAQMKLAAMIGMSAAGAISKEWPADPYLEILRLLLHIG